MHPPRAWRTRSACGARNISRHEDPRRAGVKAAPIPRAPATRGLAPQGSCIMGPAGAFLRSTGRLHPELAMTRVLALAAALALAAPATAAVSAPASTPPIYIAFLRHMPQPIYL